MELLLILIAWALFAKKSGPAISTAAPGPSGAGNEDLAWLDNSSVIPDGAQAETQQQTTMSSASPQTLNDGTYNYVLVREQSDTGNGVVHVALYERVPQDSQFQFTPNLRFTQGLSAVLVMQPIMRG